MASSADVDLAVLKESLKHLEEYVHEAEARCKERDEDALEQIADVKKENATLKTEVADLKKKLTTSAIVWATICATITTIFALAVWVFNKVVELKGLFQGMNK